MLSLSCILMGHLCAEANSIVKAREEKPTFLQQRSTRSNGHQLAMFKSGHLIMMMMMMIIYLFILVTLEI